MAKQLFVISNIDFYHEGGASYSRVIAYSSALSSLGSKVILTSIRNAVDKNNTLVNTQMEGVKHFGCPNPRIKKRFNDVYFENLYFLSYYKYIKSVYKYSKSQKIKTSFLLYPGNLALILVSLLYLKVLKGEKVFIEKNELSLGIAWNFPLNRNIFKFIVLLLLKIFLLIIFFIQDLVAPFFTGMIVISTKLENLYKSFNGNIIRIPILAEKFDLQVEKKSLNTFTIGHAGEINQVKDGIISFLEVLGKLKADYDFQFHVWGVTKSKSKVIEYNNKIKTLSLEDNIFIHPYFNKLDLRVALSKMDLLVLPRPLNLQTKYGFSTKLAEYLMVGVPVIVTDVSDNNLYINDEQNGFIVRCNSIDLLYNKMINILNKQKQQLKTIGAEGREMAERNFDNMKYAKDLNNFFYP